MLPDSTNEIFTLAADFVNNTSRHVFLTGKAGTGKTTFLRYIKENTRKQTAIIAPTGVAAINAGGVTMHSFFQLPFGPYIPGNQRAFSELVGAVADRNSLFKGLRFGAEKRELLQELELLIIDEISMVRADMLDAIDAILRHFRKNLHQPFGGVQVLFIGDMYQLPPVVAGNEWEILQPHYESPFFFSAKVIAEAPPFYIELKKIYRQNEQVFIDILNRIRNNEVRPQDLVILNNRYQPGFIAPKEEKYITLSTHNRTADAINNAELEKLAGPAITFKGTMSGDFSEKALPTEMNLQLKEGAQVMFIKNDTGIERRFYNGKLATITRISGDEIIATANDSGEELLVEKETWRNVKYTLNKENNRIEEEELGSFTQYPVRLAWAITIHKSQGLTFERAIIDAGGSFAAGQVYVALSRCTSLQGLVLLSKLHPGAIATDKKVIEFAQQEATAADLHTSLLQEARQYDAEKLVSLFGWQRISTGIDQFREISAGKKLPDADGVAALRAALFIKTKEMAEVAVKFQAQLRFLLTAALQNNITEALEERADKAIAWFIRSIGEDLLLPLQRHTATLKSMSKLKKYVADVTVIQSVLIRHIEQLMQASFAGVALCKEPARFQKYLTKPALPAAVRTAKTKQVRGASQAETLELFRQGRSIAEIAALRGLAESTIGGHLSMYILSGEVNIEQLVIKNKLDQILPVVKKMGGDMVTPVKQILGDAFSYIEIKMVFAHWKMLQQKRNEVSA